jgi:nicotinamidase-related amidase
MDLNKFWLKRDETVLVIIDVQQRLVPAMPQKVYRRLLTSIQVLAQAAKELGIPVLVTEQYPRGLGHTVEELATTGTVPALEKVSFGCCGDQGFLDALAATGRRQVLVTGMEAHVCVYQTVLGLLEEEYGVHLVKDAICSRSKQDYLSGVENAGRAGAIITTTETALFQMLRQAGTPEFKAVSALIKTREF